jgi:hypothetical protein
LASQSNIAALASPEIEAYALQQALAKADLVAATLRSGAARAKHEIIVAVLAKATLFEERGELALLPSGLAKLLGCPVNPEQASSTLLVPATRLRRGHQIRLVIEGDGPPTKPVSSPRPERDDKLVYLLAQAYQARQLVFDNPQTLLGELAKQHGKCRKHLTKLIELSCLAPDIVELIVKGQQPRWLTATKLRAMELPMSWAEQRERLLVSPL